MFSFLFEINSVNSNRRLPNERLSGAFSRDEVEDSRDDALVAVHDLGELLYIFSVNCGRNIALMKLQYALTLALDEDILIWSQMLLENGLTLLLDSVLRSDLKLLFVRISAREAARLTCTHSLLYPFHLLAVAFDRCALAYLSPSSPIDFLRSS